MTALPLLIAAALASPALAGAADFAPKGAPATLVVDFSYDAVGKQANRLDLHEWRVKRTVHLEAQLVAQAPAAWGSAGPDAGQSAQLGRAQAQVGQAGAAMAPLMAGVQAVMAKCGDDDACIERETARLGAGMAGSSQVAAAQKAGAAAAAATTPGAPRVQQWLGRAQKGSYAIAETEHRVHADPICLKLPGGRCTRDEQRQGGGALPPVQGSLASVEIDTGRGQLTVQLPMVPDLLPFTETITTDEPEGTHETPTPRGPQRRELMFAQGPGQQPSMKPFTVPLTGSGRTQSGERVVKFDGPGAEGGTLTVRWRFVAP